MKHRRSTGIFLTRTGARAAFAWRSGLSAKPHVVEASYDTGSDLWQGAGNEFKELFRRLARALPADARRADCPTRIAIPDPLVTEERLAFRDFPDSSTEAHALISWRFGNDYRKAPEDHVFVWQIVGSDDGQTQVLVRVVEKRIVDPVRRAAAAAGFFCDRMDGWSGFWPEMPTDADAQAQLWAADGWWAISCANAKGGQTAQRSGWLAEKSTAAQDLARAAKAFVLVSGADRLSLTAIDDRAGLAGNLAGDARVTVTDASRLTDPALQVAMG